MTNTLRQLRRPQASDFARSRVVASNKGKNISEHHPSVMICHEHNVFSMHEQKFETREAAVENRRKGKDVREISS